MKLIAPLISSLLLAGVYLESRTRPSPEAAAEFHGQVRAAVEALPYRVGAWAGEDVRVPPAAQALLRPNAMVSRKFRHATAGNQASVTVVQCRDTRDMQGHYPPNCYPAQGWEMANSFADLNVTLGGVLVPLRRYEFTRTGFGRQARVVIYNLFVLPGKGFALDMEEVRREASDYRTRSYGAAQIQVVMEADQPRADEQATVVELLSALSRVIEVLRSGPAGATP